MSWHWEDGRLSGDFHGGSCGKRILMFSAEVSSPLGRFGFGNWFCEDACVSLPYRCIYKTKHC